jgi:nitrite reductase/ring-hydroxylating ferredoxin subunit
MAGFVKVAKSSELPPGKAKLVEPDGNQIALFNVDGSFYAIANACTHKGGPLAEGTVNGENVTCPWHGAVFDVKTGAVLKGPTSTAVKSYAVRVAGDDIEVEI